ncbi:MAG: BlaI/MecI/CopY family transcriptional regulator [Gammaproteobacteria bacterium]|nr:BlaI/MecI/CopY family transcriptional regulator [Gammaproteobacteria bacterium]
MKKIPESRSDLPRPTEAELGILRVLWRLGPATVRQVHETLSKKTPTGYTTVLKLLQIMHQKGLVERDNSNRAHVYVPVKSKEQTQRQLLGDFLSRVFEGSSSQLVMQALGSGDPASPEDLQKIRELLDKLSGDEQ